MKEALKKIEEKFALSHEEQELKEMIEYNSKNARFKLDVTCDNGYKYSLKYTTEESLRREIASIERNQSWDKRNYTVSTI